MGTREGMAVRLLSLVAVAAMVCGVSAWAEVNESAADGFITVKGVPTDEPYSSEVLQTILGMLDIHVAQLTYENPGPHELEFYCKLYVDHDNERAAESVGVTGPIDLDAAELSLVAIIQERDEGLRVKLRAPDASIAGTDFDVEVPKSGSQTAQRMRNEIPLDTLTPIYCIARTEEQDLRGVFGRSDLHVIAAYEWAIIVYAKITPLDTDK